MTGTRFDDASFGAVAVARRSGFDESLHHGAGVVVDGAGSVVASVGDPTLGVYPRSALKPLQAAAMNAAGLDLPDRLLAIVGASHAGEAAHLASVVEILERHGLTVDDLGNTAALPYGPSANAAARAGAVAPSALLQNCSGKHAGMLATCRVNGWSTDDYLDERHPLQLAISSTIESLGASVAHVGVDGCGAPTHVLPLDDLARSVSRLVVDEVAIVCAMTAYPETVGGSDLDVTAWMTSVPGLLAKEGADGVMVLAMTTGPRRGWSAVFKVADGSDRVRRAVVPEALAHLGVDVARVLGELGDRVSVPVYGHGRPVGEIRPLPWPAI